MLLPMVTLLKLSEKMRNSLLIISHYFPPKPGVGGRRWIKFSKYLIKSNLFNIYVVSASQTNKHLNSSYTDDLKKISLNHTIIDSNYPKYLELLDFKKSTLLSKIMFRLQHFLIKKKFKGNYWDFSINWKPHFKTKIPNIIQQNDIKKLIISGPPYRYVEYACNLKNKFPKLEIILDYRDPWNDFNNPKTFEKERHNFEINLEKQILKKVDKIITVSEFQKSLILKREPDCAPIYIIPNGYDPDDYIIENKVKTDLNQITISHFGTLHQQKVYYWKPFFKAYLTLKKENITLYNKINIKLIGYTPTEIIKFIKKHNLDVKIFGMLPPKEAIKLLHSCDIALWFKYDGSPGDFATKFGDYIALKKFMWVFSVKGTVTDYIEKNKIGKVFYRNTKNLEKEILNEFKNIDNITNRQFNSHYDSNILNIENITKELIKVINAK